MFPLVCFQCARKSIVFERHIFMLERLNFFHRCHPRQQRNQSHVTLAKCRSTYIQSPLPRQKSRVQRLDFHQMYITHQMTLKITARKLETAARSFLVTCAAAQLIVNIDESRYEVVQITRFISVRLVQFRKLWSPMRGQSVAKFIGISSPSVTNCAMWLDRSANCAPMPEYVTHARLSCNGLLNTTEQYNRISGECWPASVKSNKTSSSQNSQQFASFAVKEWLLLAKMHGIQHCCYTYKPRGRTQMDSD